jgi:hypothetical protein
LVEQRTENPRVGGSIPSLATINIEEKRIERCAFCFWCVVGVSINPQELRQTRIPFVLQDRIP